MVLSHPQIEDLWHSCAGRVRRFIHRLTGDPDTADDLLSQTFLEAARSWEQFRGRSSREAWLFGIARNVVRRDWRRERIRHTEPLVHEPPVVDSTANEEQEELACMRSAIRELPDKLRQTLTLRLTDEMSYEEIAAALGVPIGTVRSRLHEAVRQLRKRMEST